MASAVREVVSVFESYPRGGECLRATQEVVAVIRATQEVVSVV